MTSQKQTAKYGDIIRIPREVAVCPYCGGELIARPEAWSENDDGIWEAQESGLDCVTEPELDPANESTVEEWDDWIARHTYMPYVYWLPVDMKVTKWINANYRWKHDP